MKNCIALSILALLSTAGISVSSAADLEWTGAGVPSFWSNPANWSPAQIPGAVDNVLFTAAGATNIEGDITSSMDISSPAPLVIGNLFFENGSAQYHGLDLDGNTLQVSGTTRVGFNTYTQTSTVYVTAGNFQIGSPGNRAGNVSIGYVNAPGGDPISGKLVVDGFSFDATVGNLDLGRRFNGNSITTTGELDLSKAGNTTIDANRIFLGTGTDNGNRAVTGFLHLPTNGTSVVTSPDILLGNSTPSGNQGTTSLINLGSNTDVNFGRMRVGGFKSNGTVRFTPGTTGNEVTLNGDNLELGFNTSGTGTAAKGNFNGTNGSINGNVGQLTIGRHGGGTGNGQGTFLMDAGSLTAGRIELALTDQEADSSNDAATTAFLRLRGGDMSVTNEVVDGLGLSQVFIEGGNLTVTNGFATDRIVIGRNARTANLRADGPVRIGNGGQNSEIARRDSGSGQTIGVVDFSRAPSVNIDANQLRIGSISTGNSGSYGTLLLSETGTNRIDVGTLTVGDSGQAGNTGQESLVQFGSSTNLVEANFIHVGRRKSKALFDLGPGGHLDIRGRNQEKAALLIGFNDTSTGTNAEGRFVTTNGTLTAAFSDVIIGLHNASITTGGSGKGTFHMGAGSVTADSVAIANPSAVGISGLPDDTTGTIIIEGGSFDVAGPVLDGGGQSQVDVKTGRFTATGAVDIDITNITGATNEVGALAVNPGPNTPVRIGSLNLATNTVLRLNYGASPEAIATSDSTFDNGAQIEVGLLNADAPSTNALDGTRWVGGTNVWDATVAHWDNGLPSGATITNGTSFTAITSTDEISDGGLSSATPGWDVNVTSGTTGTVEIIRSGSTLAGQQVVALFDDPAAVAARALPLVVGNATNSGADASQILIDNGAVLGVSGGISSDGGSTLIHVDHGFLVVTNGGLTAHDFRAGYLAGTSLVQVVGGPVQLGTPNLPVLDIARREGNPGANNHTVSTVDLRAAGPVNIETAALRVGTANNANGPVMEGQLLLSEIATNRIASPRFTVGDSPLEGNSAFPFGPTNRVIFGGMENIVLADRIDIGHRKAVGHATITPGGTLNIDGLNTNGVGTILDIGFNEVGTGTISDGLVDLSGGSLNANLSLLRIGRHNNGGGSGRGTLIMDDGAVTVSANVELARTNVGGTSTNPNNTTGTLTLNGGSFDVAGEILDQGGIGTLNVNGVALRAAAIRNLNAFALTAGSVRAQELTGTEAFVMSGGVLAVDLADTDIVVTGGVIAPGESAGTTVMLANHALSNASWEIEIDGADHDAVLVSSNLTLGAGATLDITNLNDTVNEAIVFGAYGTLAGTFATTNNLPDGWTVDYNYNGTGEIALVQIPGVITNVVTTPENGGVIVEWATSDDTLIDGFFVERADSSNVWQRLTGTMIPAGNSPTGAMYSYSDTTALPGVNYAYRIITVEGGGPEIVNGPYRRVARQQVAMMIPQETEIRWASNEGETYTLQRSPSLSNPSWTNIAFGIAATPPENVETDASAGDARQYYRVVVE